MPSHRIPRIAEAIREVVSSAILFDVADPRVKGVTVLGVEVSSDMRNAQVAVSLMGTEAEQVLTMRGIQHATGFLQAKVAARLQTRTTPVLSFKRDEGIKKSIEISKLIEQALESDRRDPTPQAPTDGVSETSPDDQPDD